VARPLRLAWRTGTAIEAALVDGQLATTGDRHWTPDLRAGGEPIQGDKVGRTRTACGRPVDRTMYVINGDLSEVSCEACLTEYAAHKIQQEPDG